MSVWFCIPSARPREEAEPVLAKWREMGYKIALLRQGEPVTADILIGTDQYCGWARSINALAEVVLKQDPEAEWIVSGGDDTEPDPNHRADEIARECTAHFGGTFGVMQPTGDRWADGSIDRICGSPWLGRAFCERMYQGKGPMFEGYLHMFGDEELQNVAQRLGVLWQRRDLTHLHKHYFRTEKGAVDFGAPIPPHMIEWNSRKHWIDSQALFNSRRVFGFPGHEPLPEGSGADSPAPSQGRLSPLSGERSPDLSL
jgi:hypothetical protein